MVVDRTFVLSAVLGLLLATPLAAQENTDGEADKPNPYLDTPAPELRRKLADLKPVFREKWYRVEALAFARENPVTREYWRLDQEPAFIPNPVYLAGMAPADPQMIEENYLTEDAPVPAEGDVTPLLPREADGIDRAAVEHGAWVPLDEEALKDGKVLEAMRARMENRAGYRILFHESWRQPIRERGRALAVHVEGGERLEPLPGPSPLEPLDPPPESPAPLHPAETAAQDLLTGDGETEAEAGAAPGFSEMRGELKLHLARYLHVEPNLWFTDSAMNGERFHTVIDQHRRMRSEELHYLDHPLFGLLLYIEPWKTPEQKKAEQMEEALKKQMEREEG